MVNVLESDKDDEKKGCMNMVMMVNNELKGEGKQKEGKFSLSMWR
jgi:hypothetical protein